MALSGDRVVPAKIERADLGGDALDASPHDFPSPLDPGSDVAVARGFAPQPAGTEPDSTTLDHYFACDADGNATIRDPNTGEITPADLPFAERRASFEEYVFTGEQLDAVIVWTDSGKTQKIREELFTYSGDQIDTITTKQYDTAGALFRTQTEPFSFTGDLLDNVDRTVT